MSIVDCGAKIITIIDKVIIKVGWCGGVEVWRCGLWSCQLDSGHLSPGPDWPCLRCLAQWLTTPRLPTDDREETTQQL